MDLIARNCHSSLEQWNPQENREIAKTKLKPTTE
jgi:hypothetical protein